MIDSDVVALKNLSHDGRPLIDYLTAYAPCHLLQIDVLAIEHSDLPVTIEFVLKALGAGLSQPTEIGGILGLPSEYTAALIEHMKDSEYLSGTPTGDLAISRKGLQVLADEGDRRIVDIALPVLWDPIAGVPIETRPDLLPEKHVAGEKIRLKVPAGLKTPAIEDIGLGTIQKLKRKSDDDEVDQLDVLRLLGVRRSTLRYRPVTLLLFSNGKMPPIPKLVFDGKIDEPFSAAFAQKDGLRYLGVDPSFNRRAGAVAVEDRVKKLRLQAIDEAAIRPVVERRAALHLKLENLRINYLEDPSLASKEALETYRGHLDAVRRELHLIPVRPLNPSEIAVEVRDALEDVCHSMSITTTLPCQARFGAAQIEALKAALLRDVKVGIFVADRLPAGPNNLSEPLVALNQLAAEFSNLTVQFLKQPRSVFEVFWDDRELFFSNDATLGDRPEATLPRAFKGYRVSSAVIAKDYATKYLDFSNDDVLTKIISRPKARATNGNHRNSNGDEVAVRVKPRWVIQRKNK